MQTRHKRPRIQFISTFPELSLLSLTQGGVPWLAQPSLVSGQSVAVSPGAKQATLNCKGPSAPPDHRLQLTSINEPVSAPLCPVKNALAAPESSQRSKWKSVPWEFTGSPISCPHHSSFPATGHISVTLTIIVLKGPVSSGLNGSVSAVTEKHLPQAFPGPNPGTEPKAS